MGAWSRSVGSDDGIPEGIWRQAAFAFLLLAVVAGVLALTAPQLAGWTVFALLMGVAAVAALMRITMRPRVDSDDGKIIADAARRLPLAFAVTDREGALLYCNASYRRLLAVGDDAPPPQLASFARADEAALYRLRKHAAAGEAASEALGLPDGTKISVAVDPMPDGSAVWWFSPQPESVLEPAAHSSALPEALLQRMPIGIAFVEGRGAILQANPAFAAFFRPAASVDGVALADLVEPSQRASIAARLSATGDAVGEVLECRPAGHAERTGELSFARDGDRSLVFLVDVSDRKSLETKFAQSQKMQAVGQLAGGVAHDFNNLLTVIIGNCEFLLMRHPAGDPSFKEINEIHQNAVRAAALVGQLLAFSRKQTLQPRTLDLRLVLSELALMLRRLLREGVELKLDHGEGLWPVSADEAQISNAIINLVVNARDALPKGGTIRIATANETVGADTANIPPAMPPGDYVRITVSDTGIGISKDNIEKIFDPFFTTKPVGQGTGLGLATVYGIVQQTGGFVAVESEEGQGTTFRVYLPRHRVDAASAIAAEPALARDITGQDTILLVEDEDAVRSFAARALKMRGYNVIEAPGGDEALEIVRGATQPIHLLITDVVMPNMDGPTLVRAVKRLKPDMPVIFMSGYAEEAFRRNDEKAEDLHFLPKPFGLKQLAAKVKDVLSGAPPPVARQ
jgi:two-component system cell cycle sensor histidine kinase/response regulator CckA